jgi:predicted MFS family arabinose efflux permease
MSLASAFATGGFGVVLAHGVANAQDAGYSPRESALSLSVVSLSGFVGKAIVGSSGDRLNPVSIWAGLMAAMAAGLGIAAFGLSGAGLLAYAALLGAGFGGVVVCQPAAIANTFGTRHFAQIAGAVYFLQATVGVLAPWLAGRTFDRTHTYRGAFMVLAAGCLLTGALLAPYKRNLS